MFWIWFLLATSQCALLYILARRGEGMPRRIEEEAEANCAIPEDKWPSVGMIVPVAGRDPRMEGALRSLLTQDYPRFVPVLVTAEENEPAAELVSRLKQDFSALRHVVAGTATGCGQKNHNSLQGIAALGDEVDVYVFCDSTHMAEPDFLRHLAAPMARGEASFSTGYHVVEPRDDQPVTLAYTLCVMLMRYLQAMSAFTQLWGGAMAMTRAAYVKYGVAQLWLENVVDDCSLTALLQVRGAKVRLCPGALLHTDAVNHSTPVWRAWMDRQVLFLKFCMPGQWKLLGLMCVMMALPIVCAALAFLGWIVNVGSGAGVLLGLFWLAAMVSALHLWRGLLAKPVPLWRWCMAFADAVRMFTSVYWQSIKSWDIIWHGIKYEVGKGGVVLRSEHSQGTK